MTSIEHTPSDFDQNAYLIRGDDLEELVRECVARIRAQSKTFYSGELCEDLQRDGRSLIDRHAGMGYFYVVELTQQKGVE